MDLKDTEQNSSMTMNFDSTLRNSSIVNSLFRVVIRNHVALVGGIPTFNAKDVESNPGNASINFSIRKIRTGFIRIFFILIIKGNSSLFKLITNLDRKIMQRVAFASLTRSIRQ